MHDINTTITLTQSVGKRRQHDRRFRNYTVQFIFNCQGKKIKHVALVSYRPLDIHASYQFGSFENFLNLLEMTKQQRDTALSIQQQKYTYELRTQAAKLTKRNCYLNYNNDQQINLGELRT